MSKHTRGPWLVEMPDRDHWCSGASIIGDLPNDYIVADVRNHLSVKDQAEANAHLIAAAPEMLDALKGAEDALRVDGYDKNNLVRAAVLAAIAKAEGRS